MTVDIAGARRLFTVEDYHRMAEVGILKPHDRVELIRGEIVEMSPIGRRHAAFVDNPNELPPDAPSSGRPRRPHPPADRLH